MYFFQTPVILVPIQTVTTDNFDINSQLSLFI